MNLDWLNQNYIIFYNNNDQCLKTKNLNHLKQILLKKQNHKLNKIIQCQQEFNIEN